MYLLFELCDCDLRTYLNERGAIPPQLLAQGFRDVCLGLAHCHAALVIHRDVKVGGKW